jgi:predicted RecB family nuclease
VKIIGGVTSISASDVSNFLACRHLSLLDSMSAHGLVHPSRAYDVGLEKLIARGEAHEAKILERFQSLSYDVIEIAGTSEDQAARQTRDAISAGVPIIYQGVLVSSAEGVAPTLLGRPDFLVRSEVIDVTRSAQLDAQPGYEVVDAKLSRSAKARAVLQTAFYSHLLASAQGYEPSRMHLALGDGEFATLRVADFAAYERRMRALLDEFLKEGAPPESPFEGNYPEPVEHCTICRWSADCESRRRSDDDLSLVAGMPSGQRVALKQLGVATRRRFAALSPLPSFGRRRTAALERSQLQARLQVTSEDAGQVQYELLDPESDEQGALIGNRGLLALPAPSPGDLFFDIEGARYYTEDGREFGLQYLFGVVDSAQLSESGSALYNEFWSYNREEEKRAFQSLIDFITERRRTHPDLHVYHYNHYEPTSIDHLTALHGTHEEAVGHLMGRFATREDEVDGLFRLGVFVDLYRVVRQALRAGVESYSIKRLEPLVGFEREVALRDATAHLIAFEADLDEGTAHQDNESQRVVAGYNEDDCRSTMVLRDWLEDRRAELATRLGLELSELPRPAVLEEDRSAEDPEVSQLKIALTSSSPADGDPGNGFDEAKALVADLLEWHRREAKPGWWRYFFRRDLASSELVQERDAIGDLSGGDVVDHVRRSVVRRYSFPPQEHGFDVGDPAFDPVGMKSWTVHDLDEENGTIDLRIGVGNDSPLPSQVIETGPFDTSVLALSLREFAETVVDRGLEELQQSDAAAALLLRHRPVPNGGVGDPLRLRGEGVNGAALRLVGALRHSYLPVQGPPGSGKTFIGADAILATIAAGMTVGVTAPSHAVIHNLLCEVISHAAETSAEVRIGQRASADNPWMHEDAQSMQYPELLEALTNRAIDIAAGTIFMWARAEFANAVDVLFVDEAAQMSLANALAASRGAQNVVLLGDPQQLAQPSQASHPPGSGVSALEHVLQEHKTMPEDRGLFLDRTYRMHPRLCRFSSDAFYEGRLSGVPELARQEIRGLEDVGDGTGLHVIEVPHHGNSNASPEEAREAARLISALLDCTWIDQHGEGSPMTARDVLVVTPYNAQVREIRRTLTSAGISGVQVGTVDKFQGREAPAVIYSMATSSADDAPRGFEFLFDLHRLNVATSRARALGIILANPDLARVFCRTPRQMMLANALCLAWEC